MATIVWEPVPGTTAQQVASVLWDDETDGSWTKHSVGGIWQAKDGWTGYYTMRNTVNEHLKRRYKTLNGIKRHMEKVIWVHIISGTIHK